MTDCLICAGVSIRERVLHLCSDEGVMISRRQAERIAVRLELDGLLDAHEGDQHIDTRGGLVREYRNGEWGEWTPAENFTPSSEKLWCGCGDGFPTEAEYADHQTMIHEGESK